MCPGVPPCAPVCLHMPWCALVYLHVPQIYPRSTPDWTHDPPQTKPRSTPDRTPTDGCCASGHVGAHWARWAHQSTWKHIVPNHFHAGSEALARNLDTCARSYWFDKMYHFGLEHRKITLLDPPTAQKTRTSKPLFHKFGSDIQISAIFSSRRLFYPSCWNGAWNAFFFERPCSNYGDMDLTVPGGISWSRHPAEPFPCKSSQSRCFFSTPIHATASLGEPKQPQKASLRLDEVIVRKWGSLKKAKNKTSPRQQVKIFQGQGQFFMEIRSKTSDFTSRARTQDWQTAHRQCVYQNVSFVKVCARNSENNTRYFWQRRLRSKAYRIISNPPALYASSIQPLLAHGFYVYRLFSCGLSYLCTKRMRSIKTMLPDVGGGPSRRSFAEFLRWQF